MERKIELKYELYKTLSEVEPIVNTLYKKAIDTARNAYSVYSGFSVGAALILHNNEIITGSNQENAAYPSGLCAERVAVFYANSKFPNIPIKYLVITALNSKGELSSPVTPCGACRQVLLETEQRYKNNISYWFIGKDEIIHLTGINNLLPLAFDKEQL